MRLSTRLIYNTTVLVSTLLVILLMLTSNSIAKVGYCIDVSVDGATWQRCQSGEPMNFKMESASTGSGNYTKYLTVGGMAGIALKDNIYAKRGRLIDKNVLSLESGDPVIEISQVTNNSSKVTYSIDENFPVYLTSESQTYYRGQGIYARNKYVNNDDNLRTDYQAASFTRSSKYVAARTNAIVAAEVTPQGVNQTVKTNYATAFRSSSQSDRYSAYKFGSSDACLDETYWGQASIDLKLVRKHKFNIVTNDDWLGCCSGNESFTGAIFINEDLYKTMQA
jgi:hypothetical protein